MNLTERDIESAEAMVGLERDEGIARIRSSLACIGGADCIDCGSAIPPERRSAMPSARRCVTCQTRHERGHP